MQPFKGQLVKICPLIRCVSTEILNNGMSDRFSVALDLKAEGAAVMGQNVFIQSKRLLQLSVFRCSGAAARLLCEDILHLAGT